jgi:hypothetical protein
VALNIGIQNNLTAQGANGSSFEALIVSDLEFLGLRQREGYEHRPHERQAREVEAEIVPVDLSGTLALQGHPGAAVVSKTQAEATQLRVRQVDAKVEALLAAKGKASGNGQNGANPPSPSPAAPAAEMKLPPIVMPASAPSESWWAQLVSGDNRRQIAKEAAIEVCRIVLREILGALVAQNTPIKFDEPIALRDLHAAIQDLTGVRGWSVLLKKAGHG